MTKLIGAAFDRAVANAMGLKSVHNCEKWVGLTDEERDAIEAATLNLHGIPKFFATAIEAKRKEKNA